MYSPFQLLKKYLHYLFTSSNGIGHGVHSPFVFDFIKYVLNDDTQYEPFNLIEQQRRKLLQDKRKIEVVDFGAGSGSLKNKQRQIGAIATSSLKPKKYSQLLFRIVQKYNAKVIIELGTSLGITSSYLASANPSGQVSTLEGSETIAEVAAATFRKLNLINVDLLVGNFENTLSPCLNKLPKIDLAFVDGNHQQQPTLNYFQILLEHSHDNTILIFDDIHWSEGMEAAWDEIKRSPKVTLSIDLFFIGVVFLNPEFLVPQHFKVRF